MGMAPLPVAPDPGSRGKGTARRLRPLRTQDEDWVEGEGQGKTPGKSGHSDLMTKPIFSGKTKSISTLTHYCPER